MFNQAFEDDARGKAPLLIRILIIIIILAILGGALYFYQQRQSTYVQANGSSGYQAVFLTSGQVYFGKITSYDPNSQLILTNIYYLQSQQNPQDNKQNSNPNISLVKLGNEIHGPVDQMDINSRQVLFVEDLKSNSKVVQAINSYQKSK